MYNQKWPILHDYKIQKAHLRPRKYFSGRSKKKNSGRKKKIPHKIEREKYEILFFSAVLFF